MSSLLVDTLEGPVDIVGKAIKELQNEAKFHSLCGRFSGGKDSIVLRHLCRLAGVPCEFHFSRTSVDPPELLSYISRWHPDVVRHSPTETMFQKIIRKGFPPTRICRYCCQDFKERNVCPKSEQTLTLTGIRKEESRKRRTRSKYELCQLSKGVVFFHPVIDWSEEQIWDFIELERLPYCSLYDEGFTRIGCVGCPMTSSGNMVREFTRWPNFEKAYLWAFERMLEGRHFDRWKTKYDVLEWYIFGIQKQCEQLEGQITFYDAEYYEQFGLPEDNKAVAETVEAARFYLAA